MDLAEWMRRVAGVAVPDRLTELLEVLAGEGFFRGDPDEVEGLFPLLLPFGRDAEGSPVGLLRWPTPAPGAPLPLVRQELHSLVMLAPSVEAFLLERTPGVSLARRLEIGVNPAFFEERLEAHLARGDTVAALVTADRATQAFEGWARPHAVRARLLARLGRMEEARDGARWTLLQPVWTLGEAFAPIARLAGWPEPIHGGPYRRLASDPTKPPLDRAAHLMDAASVDGESWDDLRGPLAALYGEAGLPAVARLVGRTAGALRWA